MQLGASLVRVWPDVAENEKPAEQVRQATTAGQYNRFRLPAPAIFGAALKRGTAVQKAGGRANPPPPTVL